MAERLVVALRTALCAVLVSPALSAQSSSEVALAETLYQQGRELVAQGRFGEACPKFAESYRLDRATGTLLNLAACHEGEGKLATAWTEFSEALAAARRDGRPDRVKYAEERLSAIEPRLSRLTVTVAPGASVEGLEVRLDGALLGGAALGIATPVDPGTHTVTAQAPGKLPWSSQIVIKSEADNQTVAIPVLNDQPAPAAPAPAPAPAPVSSHAPVADLGTERPTPVSVYVCGGITLAFAAGAVITGSMYMNENDGSDRDSAKTLGIVNAALWGGAAALGGLTTYLFLTRPEERASTTVSVAPWALPTAAGFAVQGRY